jgi:phosphotriesterase-related protein
VQGRGAVATRRQPGVDYYGDECDTGGEDTTATTVDTAIGPTATTELGPTLMHEHIVTRSPGVQENWPHLWDRAAILAIAERKLADLYSRGIRTIVDLTTVDLGRDIGLIADVARRSRVHVIVATGVWWMPQRYFSAHGVDAVADLFIRDIRQGIGESSIKAAIIKCATDTAGVTPVIENILRASARAQKATGRDAAGDLRTGGGRSEPCHHRPQR